MEVFVENLDKIVNGFQIKQVVVRHINTNAEVETGIASVDYLEITKFDKIRVLGIPNCKGNKNYELDIVIRRENVCAFENVFSNSAASIPSGHAARGQGHPACIL